MNDDFYRMQLAQLQANLDAARQMRQAAEAEYSRLAMLIEEIAKALLAPELDAHLVGGDELPPAKLAHWIIREGRSKLNHNALLLRGDLPARLNAMQTRIAELEAELHECRGLQEEVARLKAQLAQQATSESVRSSTDTLALQRVIDESRAALASAGCKYVIARPQPVSFGEDAHFTPDLEVEYEGDHHHVLVETRETVGNPARHANWAAGATLSGRLNFVVQEILDQDALLQALSLWAYEGRATLERVQIRICCLKRLEEGRKLWQVERDLGARR